MRARKLLLAVVAASLLLCAVGWTGYAQRSAPKRVTWEYKVVGLSTSYAEDKTLNEFGAQGWEFVAVSDVGGSNYYFFKRPK